MTNADVDRTIAEKQRRAELKTFLRARRSALTPESIGLPRGSRRLTPGLRREEVAVAASVGLSWYTWLEQGRAINISAAALGRVASALRLGLADRAYLFWLAGLPHADPPAFGMELPSAVHATLATYAGPAVVLDPVFELLAANDMADRLFEFGSSVGSFHNNQIWQLFMNSRRRSLYVNHDSDVRHFTALFRLASASLIGNARLQRLVEALHDASPLFRQLWSEQLTSSSAPHTTVLRSEFGLIQVLSLRLPLPSFEGGSVVFLAPADTEASATFVRIARELRC